MKFVKDEDEKRDDYIFQKDKITKKTAKFVIIALIILIIAVIASGVHFGYF
ncbi:hypothetical protein [Winogradskyella sp. A3E31]|uniref:hypothetical protein n=1 Tax=Winogradskyella sp. A3E31 TaxID=3349637 RepID=UPI00398AB7F2